MTRRTGMITLVWIVVFSLSAWGEIDNLQVKLVSPTEINKKYNDRQVVSVQATWDVNAGVATPPFAATFKVNSSVMGSSNVSDGSADFSISASSLPEQTNQFSATVIETSVPNAVMSGEVSAGGGVIVDRTPPTVTLTIVSGAVVSPMTGHNEVLIQFVAGEELGEAPTFTITPGSLGAPTPVAPETAPFIVNQYKISVPAGTPGGAYTVTATAKDNTEPATGRNAGTGQISFTVDALAGGAPAIQSCSPQSPVRTTYLTLTGTIEAETGAQTVEVLEGTTVVGTANVAANGTSWNVTISSLTEGTHKYKARRTDPLGNTSGEGNEMTVVVDRTAPHLPTLTPPKSPVNTTKVQISGTLATDDPHKSFPVKVTLVREGTVIGTANANSDGTFTFTDVTLTAGTNLLLAQAADTTWDSAGSAGNQTAYSVPVTIVLDQTGPSVVPGGVIVSSPGSTTSPPPAVPASATAAPDRFMPPAGAPALETVRLEFPVKPILDRYPEGVAVYLVSKKDAGQPVPDIAPMTLEGDRFVGPLACAGTGPVAYHFLLADQAGNISYYPDNGDFTFHPRRAETLAVSGAGGSLSDPAADQWPVDSCGVPPVERLVTYRTIIVDAISQPVVEQALRERGLLDTVTIQVEATPVSAAPYQIDLDLLRQNRLPEQRLDLLMQDIAAEKIPVEHLPELPTIPAHPGYQGVRDAIQFRLLHATPHQ